jgi:methionyl-tRNA formyltransferase
MNRYVLATQQPWGRDVFARARRNAERWALAEPGCKLTSVLVPPARYVFFIHWSTWVPPDVLALSECVNFHCTALPYGRGGGPIENLIQRGHTETVLTAHRMTDDLDAGPIYGTRGPISLTGNKADILARFIEPCVELIRWIVDTEPEPVPQVGEVVTFTRLPPAERDALWSRRG